MTGRLEVSPTAEVITAFSVLPQSRRSGNRRPSPPPTDQGSVDLLVVGSNLRIDIH